MIGLETVIKIEECNNCRWKVRCFMQISPQCIKNSIFCPLFVASQDLFDPEVSISDLNKWEFAFNYSVAKWRKYRPRWLEGIACVASLDSPVGDVNQCLKQFPDVCIDEFIGLFEKYLI